MASPLSIPNVVPASQLAPPDSRYPVLATPAGVAFPRGRITEIYGEASSGRTSLLYSALGQATKEECESCALVDACPRHSITDSSTAHTRSDTGP